MRTSVVDGGRAGLVYLTLFDVTLHEDGSTTAA